jgi:hypothetical protein
MGCTSSTPREGRSEQSPAALRKSEAPHAVTSSAIDGVTLADRQSPDQDTTASGQISSWQVPLIWDLKYARSPSLQRLVSADSALPHESIKTPSSEFIPAPGLRRSRTERGTVKLEQRISHSSRRNGTIGRESSAADISVMPSKTLSMTRSRSYTSTSPAGSMTSTPMLPSPASSNASSDLSQSFHTRKGFFRRSNDDVAPKSRSTLRSSASFSDVSRRRF